MWIEWSSFSQWYNSWFSTASTYLPASTREARSYVILLAPMCLLQSHECMHIQSVCILCMFTSGYFRSSPALTTETLSSLTYNNLISGRNLGSLLSSTAALVWCWLHTEDIWELTDALRAASGLPLTKPGSPEGAACHKKHLRQCF